MKWIRTCCIIKSPDGHVVEDLPSRFLVQIANSLVNYKGRAEMQMLEGAPHSTLKMVKLQVTNMVECDDRLQETWRKKDDLKLPSNSLELANKSKYTVEWQAGWEKEWRHGRPRAGLEQMRVKVRAAVRR